ncbi:uncharacterized protein isoform X3 [Bombus fervidus]|uniref:uncharacterized protein isoform X3 n=1 Tax=Bombus fervidus TaxID=203811 RepID=UPI003D189A39
MRNIVCSCRTFAFCANLLYYHLSPETWTEVKCHEFTICGLHSTASSDDTCDTDSDQLETFSMTVTRCLRKLDKPYALKAQAEIQQILENMLIKSKNDSPKRTRLHESSYDL